MPAYEFTALNARGGQEKGLLEGDTPRQARSQLRDRGLTPLEVHEVAEGRAASRGAFSRGGGWSHTELTLFTRQLATLARSGLPLDEALAATSPLTGEQRKARAEIASRQVTLR